MRRRTDDATARRRRGSYYPHCRMGSVVHSFVRPPPRLAAETTRTAASTGQLVLRHGFVPSGRPAPRRQPRRKQRATKAPATGNRRAMRRAGGRQHNHRKQWTRANNNQPLRVEGGRAAACGKSSGRRKGEGRCRRGGRAKWRRIVTTTRKRIAPLPPPLLSLLLLPLPPPQAATPAPPLLPLIKQWQQWQQHGVVACGGAR
jgi:hypothetical protein